ncbi:MAG TPA: DEAD/DEAH box helicase [Deltaproteobacteria bacterium]|jgi:DEAD/DEAH box helicase domain-containing protein|nr:DEAD/DEAH box helicase [Deltaproteobacteria bacterium]NMD39853.1 DEAD/DEAH box helicase [Deltaproteobacteria bacterium]HNQ86472.1 DEAD/DEAH box helicase [Deltaproteobacteria bacterium]HOC76434.1 DEAD/DEAH box helicase [Deltaproteobacteria bacterium]HPA76141.1 DEAD/DEAH box helicase [Deltaproteobacteria bacterium]
MATLSLEEWLERAESDRRFRENATSITHIPASEGSFAPYPSWVHPRLKTVLEKRGLKRLYSHQAQAVELVRQGRDVVLVTPTASGKTLCYNLPVLQRILEEPETRALYLFPTKALANDQMHEVHGLIGELKADIKTFTYDGDTPDDARQAIRRQGHVVVTNPDMLHTGILPHHTKWQKLFANLTYVVVDELHVYRGVFGSHLTNVFRRLKRVCRFYGTDPVFICCSATVANPGEHAENLLEKEVALIDESGAPRAAKTFILYNPPIVNRELGIRQSALTPARKIAGDLIGNHIQTIVFTTSRLNVEVLTKYLKDGFRGKIPGRDHFVTGYRGGYLPNLRRDIEKGLRERTVMGVVSTNALELGIDIGDLQACLMAGYPGSIASTWQQAGRAGRRTGHSLAILIARSNPMDQFIVENPEYFFARSPEHCRVNPDNLLILLHHIKSAAFELPFEEGERFGKENLMELLTYLEDKGVLHRVQARWHWAAESYPADEVSLRTINPENIVVVDTTDAGNHKVIAEVDWDSAFTTVHDDAIYMVESQQYHVDKLDLDRKKAYVRRVDVDYYTDAMTYTNVRVIEDFDKKSDRSVIVEHGEVQVARKVVGYKKIKFYTSENVGYGDVSLPQKDMHTTSYWFTIPWDLLDFLDLRREEIIDGLAGLAYCLHHIAAMLVMADIRDLDRCIGDKSGEWFVRYGADRRVITATPEAPVDVMENAFDPTVFIFDAYPGGIGFSDLLFARHEELLAAARSVIGSCPCEHGCPMCVGPTLEVGPSAKSAALQILALMDRP